MAKPALVQAHANRQAVQTRFNEESVREQAGRRVGLVGADDFIVIFDVLHEEFGEPFLVFAVHRDLRVPHIPRVDQVLTTVEGGGVELILPVVIHACGGRQAAIEEVGVLGAGAEGQLRRVQQLVAVQVGLHAVQVVVAEQRCDGSCGGTGR